MIGQDVTVIRSICYCDKVRMVFEIVLLSRLLFDILSIEGDGRHDQ